METVWSPGLLGLGATHPGVALTEARCWTGSSRQALARHGAKGLGLRSLRGYRGSEESGESLGGLGVGSAAGFAQPVEGVLRPALRSIQAPLE